MNRSARAAAAAIPDSLFLPIEAPRNAWPCLIEHAADALAGRAVFDSETLALELRAIAATMASEATAPAAQEGGSGPNPPPEHRQSEQHACARVRKPKSGRAPINPVLSSRIGGGTKAGALRLAISEQIRWAILRILDASAPLPVSQSTMLTILKLVALVPGPTAQRVQHEITFLARRGLIIADACHGDMQHFVLTSEGVQAVRQYEKSWEPAAWMQS